VTSGLWVSTVKSNQGNEVNNQLNAVTPRGSEPSRYCEDVRIALSNIASLKPVPGCILSETALVVATTGQAGHRACRDVYRGAFDLLLDAGYVTKQNPLWRFKRAFSQQDVNELVSWTGMSVSERACHQSNR
jgi:hypothetical protein